MGQTSIQWTNRTWSPLRVRVREDAAAIATAKGYTSLVQIAAKMAGHVGPHCEHVSHGCDNCYSDTNNGRCLPANGTGLPFDRRSRDLVDPFVDEKILLQPLRWKAPQKVFLENQSDLFGEWVTDEAIDRVFAVMALCQRHSFQVLTKRPERMLKWFSDIPPWPKEVYMDTEVEDFVSPHTQRIEDLAGATLGVVIKRPINSAVFPNWPLPNVWLGVSAEDQKTWDERTAILEEIPAAIRFVSLEPQLEAVDVGPVLKRGNIHWLVQGGESGSGARPFEMDWAREALEQCRDYDVRYFLKQVGAKCMDGSIATGAPGFGGHPDGVVPVQRVTKDRKGGSMSEWPEWARVREFPKTRVE